MEHVDILIVEDDKALKGETRNPLMMVLTSSDDSDTIIETMRTGVFDYILKPARKEDLLFKVSRAMENAKLKALANRIDQGKLAKLKEQQHCSKYFGKLQSQSIGKQSIFHNLHTNFNQGNGFGALLSIMQYFLENTPKDGEDFIIRLDPDMRLLLQENIDFSKRLLDRIYRLSHIDLHEVKLKSITADSIYNTLENIVQKLEKYISLDQNKIILSKRNPRLVNVFLNIDEELLEIALTEMVMNALKFSGPQSEILILVKLFGGQFSIGVINPAIKFDTENGVFYGIPEGYETKIKKPFFRLHKYMYEAYQTLDFGLGLPMVEQIAIKFDGNFEISTLKDHTVNEKNQHVIHAEILLPLVEENVSTS